MRSRQSADVSESCLTQFSHPRLCVGGGLSEHVVRLKNQKIWELFLFNHRQSIEKATDGVISTVAEWVQTEHPDYWNAAFGKMDRWLTDASASLAADLATRTALHASARLKEVRWIGRLNDRYPAQFLNYVLPKVEQIEFHKKDDRTEVIGKGKSNNFLITLIGENNQVKDVQSEGKPGYIAPRQENIEVVSGYHVDRNEFKLLQEWVPISTDTDPLEGWAHQLNQALALMANVSKSYIPWVNGVVRTVIALEDVPGTAFSGSWSEAPGIIYSSMVTSVCHLADILIHEASHQRFHIAMQIGNVDDGSDTSEYFSPPVNTWRHIDRILIAYHAFANVLLFYKTGIRNGEIDFEDNASRIERYANYVESLGQTLSSNQSLTPLGESIYLPLREELRSVSVL